MGYRPQKPTPEEVRERKVETLRRDIDDARRTLRQIGRRSLVLSGAPVVIIEDTVQNDTLIVTAAEPGSLYLLKNGTVHFKTDVGWLDLRGTYETIDLDRLDPAVRSAVYQALEAELNRLAAVVERFKKAGG